MSNEIELLEWSASLLCSATPAKVLTPTQSRDWCEAFGKWFAEYNEWQSQRPTWSKAQGLTIFEELDCHRKYRVALVRECGTDDLAILAQMAQGKVKLNPEWRKLSDTPLFDAIYGELPPTWATVLRRLPRKD